MSDVTVIKVGGSLYDLPRLGERLRIWIESSSPVLLVPGGGSIADTVREWDADHLLGEERAHWLAVRALSLNAWFLRDLIPESRVWSGPFHEVPAESRLILDAWAFLRADQSNDLTLPPCWNSTSDSIAARVASVIGARELILLKSVSIPFGLSWSQAAEQGHVDSMFPSTIAHLRCPIRVINFRDETSC